MKILVVEDEPNNMMLMNIILKKDGHEPIEAFTGEEGVRKASLFKPDIVLMDLRLPDMDGFDATRKIREIIVDIPIIAVTSFSMDEVACQSGDYNEGDRENIGTRNSLTIRSQDGGIC